MSDVRHMLAFLESELATLTLTRGKNSGETIDLERKLCLACCKQGAALMEEGDWNAALSLLRRAETLSERYDDLQTEVYESISLYYGATGKHLRALAYLDKLSHLPSSSPLAKAKLHLNYCAVLSQLNKYDQAQTHALKAVFLLQDLVLFDSLREGKVGEMEMETMAAAYFNLAVVQEHLQDVSFYSVLRSQKVAQMRLRLRNSSPP